MAVNRLYADVSKSLCEDSSTVGIINRWHIVIGLGQYLLVVSYEMKCLYHQFCNQYKSSNASSVVHSGIIH